MNMTVLFSALPSLSVLVGLGSGFMLAGGASPAAETVAISAPAAEQAVMHDANVAAHDVAGEAASAERAEDRVVNLGRITVPVQKARTVSYVVADLGVSMRDRELADEFRNPEHGIRLRGALLAAMTEATALPVMQDASIDTEALSAHIARRMAHEFDGVEDVLFLSFYKADVPRV